MVLLEQQRVSVHNEMLSLQKYISIIQTQIETTILWLHNGKATTTLLLQ